MRHLIGIFSSEISKRIFVDGGTLSSDSTYYYRTFKSTSDLTITGGSLSVEYLVIAGGGAGGGGAGGVRSSSATLTAGSYTATIGSGGSYDANGNISSFNSLQSAGGGTTGSNGGSGGGGRGWLSQYGPGNGNTPSVSPSQGNSGGQYASSGGGGGGGAGGSGGSASGNNGGSGGNGTNSYSTWLSAIYSEMSGVGGGSFIGPLLTWQQATSSGYIAGGGGGGSITVAYIATRGSGGGGQGGYGLNNGDSNSFGPACDAVPNTGGGGGGGGGSYAYSQNSTFSPGLGGSGLVIVRYLKSAVGG